MPKRHHDPQPNQDEQREVAEETNLETAADIAEGSEPSAPSEAQADDAVHHLSAEVDDLKQRLAETNDQLIRTMADFQNFRKRVQQEKAQERDYAAESVVYDLLPILDNFERTVSAAESGASVESLLAGVKAIERQFRVVLESRKVNRIKAEGHPFDPDLHEAIGTQDSVEHDEGTVLHEVEPGYKMAERVLRPAKVRVAKRP